MVWRAFKNIKLTKRRFWWSFQGCLFRSTRYTKSLSCYVIFWGGVIFVGQYFRFLLKSIFFWEIRSRSIFRHEVVCWNQRYIFILNHFEILWRCLIPYKCKNSILYVSYQSNGDWFAPVVYAHHSYQDRHWQSCRCRNLACLILDLY